MNEQQNVNSSLIQQIGYNPLNEQLSVVLRNTPETTYTFRGVSRATANGLIEAGSKGQYFNRNIRGRFPTTKTIQ